MERQSRNVKRLQQMKKIFSILAILLIVLAIYNYKLLLVPTGLTVDEAAFGYNAALLAKTGKDERGVSHPVFVLSIDGKDWRQPVTQYYLAGLFRIFGSSVYLLRFSSILICLFSILAIFVLVNDILGRLWGLVATIFLATMPILVIQSHLGLDNIMPVPLTIIWLWSLFSYRKKRNWHYLIIAGIFLGINFYSYKGMRAVFPLWLLTSLIYLFSIEKTWKNKIRSFLITCVGVFPFMAVIPHLEKNYSGAILGGSNPTINNFYDLVIPYLSSFDLSYLFIRGDILLFHSTGRHGMLLLATLPWVLIGIYKIISQKKPEYNTILIALVTAPLLYSVVGSEHRFSRLLCLLPFYAIIMTLGVKHVWENNHIKWRIFTVFLFFLMFFNFSDFLRYYWKTYPGVTRTLVGEMGYYRDFETLAKESKKLNLEPVIQERVLLDSGQSGNFFQAIYFGKLLKKLPDDASAKSGEVLLTQRKEIPGNIRVGNESVNFFVQVAK